MLELRHLRSLQAIFETGSITLAANRQHLTQSALSHQIRAVEDHFGVSLLERSRAGVRLTAAGERLLALAQQVLPAVDMAERDLQRMQGEGRGELRIALECHTCFDWLMPVLDTFRQRWPEVEVDLVAGFHAEPLDLLAAARADMVIGTPPVAGRAVVALPLFRFEMLVVLPNAHRLRSSKVLQASDLEGETLITYPVPESRIDLIREVLTPAGITLPRRTAELTIAIMQLVASRRGIAALPNWGVKSYVDHDYVLARRIGEAGLWSALHACVPRALAGKAYVADFVNIVRQSCAATLDGIELL